MYFLNTASFFRQAFQPLVFGFTDLICLDQTPINIPGNFTAGNLKFRILSNQTTMCQLMFTKVPPSFLLFFKTENDNVKCAGQATVGINNLYTGELCGNGGANRLLRVIYQSGQTLSVNINRTKEYSSNIIIQGR